ncbi:MAG TPA: carboxypeptidase-like regulatory domain-containing protein [Pyrinomonadaceae bacterium]|jgi:hypothetical protein
MRRLSFLGGSAACVFGALLFALLLAGSAFAQTGTSSVRGTATDPQGNLVAGATVTLSNTEKNFTRTQVTGEDGGYVFTAVPPGTYKLEIEAAGFKKVAIENVTALVDTPVTQDAKLEVGGANETVTITSQTEAPLNTTDASIGNAIEQRRVEQLPLNARNVVGLLSLQPGVTKDGYVNGARSDQSNVTLDGVDVNEQQSGLDVQSSVVSGVNEAFASVIRSTPDSLQEFRVTTSNPNADQGRSSGAQVSLVTKSGTNQYHGSLYEFHRNTVTTANDFFNNKAGVERPQLIRNNFGGSIGGPIKRDRAFFFFTYEGFREATAESVVHEVPLPTLGQGIVRYRTASGASDPSCPAGTPAGVACLNVTRINQLYTATNGVSPGINPFALSTLASAAARYTANDTTVGDGLNTSGFRFNAPRPSSLNVYHTKFDFNLTNRQTLFARYSYQSDHATQTPRFPDTPAPIFWNHPQGIAVGHTWTISNKLVNRFNYGLTRSSFTSGGDAQTNFVSFRFIFQPLDFTRTLSRTTPVHNFVDDISYIHGNHTFGVGANVRLISNSRNSFGASFDTAITNPSFYDCSGDVVLFDEETCSEAIFPDVADESQTDLRDALTAIIGRFSQFSTDANYDRSGALLPTGTGIARTFKTQEYETYIQDSWRWRPNLTFTYGLRWSTSTPVYEANGVQVTPTRSLGDFFARRVASANNGVPLNELITVDLAGKANNKRGYYDQDWNNFAPSVAVAWSPDFGDNFLGRLLGRRGKSIIRGGYRLIYDRIGSQLAVNFDLNSTLGFHSSTGVSANTFNVSSRLGPLLTSLNPNVRPLLTAQGVNIAPSLTFPLTTPADEDQRIEQSLDDTLTTPYNHNVNVSYGREFGHGLTVEMSYVGRFARNLLASRDVMHLNNIRDPQSGMTWYEAVNRLIDLRYAGVPISSVQPIPFFENLLPGLATSTRTATQSAYRRFALPSVGGRNSTDYTFAQALWDDMPIARTNNLFFHPQYAALSVFSTIARSNYHSGQLSVRERLGRSLTFDFNYTLAHSLDNASGLQVSGAYGSAFIVNPLDPDQNYASSDFDIRHVVNANWLWELPIGRGRRFFNGMNRVANGILGGWQMTGIFRWNSGEIAFEPVEADRWATNWNVQSNMVRVRTANASPSANVNGEPNLFSDPTAVFQSFRDPRAGEVGDRNILRGPGYVSLDAGLYKTFSLWEDKTLQFRWEVYNVTNTQRFDGSSWQGSGMPQDPFLGGAPSSDFGKLTATQKRLNETTTAGRVMQFALRFQF